MDVYELNEPEQEMVKNYDNSKCLNLNFLIKTFVWICFDLDLVG